MYDDWLWLWTAVQRSYPWILSLISVQFLFTFWKRVADRSAIYFEKALLRQTTAEWNNNHNDNNRQPTINNKIWPGRGSGGLRGGGSCGLTATLCNKSTQWEDVPTGNVIVPSNSKTRSPLAKPTTATTTTSWSRRMEKLKASVARNQTSSGTGPSPNASPLVVADRLKAVATALVTNGQHHVNDLKMRFERQQPKVHHLQSNANCVKLVQHYTKPNTQQQQPPPKSRSNSPFSLSASPTNATESSQPAAVQLRRKRLNSSSCGGSSTQLIDHKNTLSVYSLEDILQQQRFSRSLSQYSVSELCWEESPGDLSKDCQRFDELFSARSIDDLRRLSDMSRSSTTEPPSTVNGAWPGPRQRLQSASSRQSCDFDVLLDESSPLADRLACHRLSKSASEYSINELLQMVDMA